MKVAMFFAYKSIIRDRKTGLLITSVLAFSFVNLVFFSSFMGGLGNTMNDQIVNTVTSHLSINPKENERYVEDISNIENKLNHLPGIVGVSPQIVDSGTVQYKDKLTSVPIIAISPSKDRGVTYLSRKVIEGDFFSDNDIGEIILGYSLTTENPENGPAGEQKLDARVGDIVTITFSNGIIRKYRVKGFMYTKFFTPDESVYITFKEMESVFNLNDKASRVLIRLSSIEDVESAKRLLMQQSIKGEIHTWKDSAGFVEMVTESFGILTVITSFVGLLTASLTIAIIIYINSTHQKRQIGILKAIGSKNRTVLGIFLIEAVIFAFGGISVGFLISYLLVAYIQANPVSLPIGDIALAMSQVLITQSALAILLASVIAGFYPAWKASRQNIVKSIWGE